MSINKKGFSKSKRADSTLSLCKLQTDSRVLTKTYYQLHRFNIKIKQKAYQFKHLARLNDGQKIITKEGQTAI